MKAGNITLSGILMVGLINAFGGTMETNQRTGSMEVEGTSEGWFVVNDGVMGGISQSRAELTDQKTLRFAGVVSLENNGGFASIRNDADTFGIQSGAGIRLWVRGDGKKYQLRVRALKGPYDIAYKTEFTTIEGEWQELQFSWEAFEATFRGRSVPDAPELEGDEISQVGFLIAGGQAGTFNLEIASIEPFRQTL